MPLARRPAAELDWEPGLKPRPSAARNESMPNTSLISCCSNGFAFGGQARIHWPRMERDCLIREALPSIGSVREAPRPSRAKRIAWGVRRTLGAGEEGEEEEEDVVVGPVEEEELDVDEEGDECTDSMIVLQIVLRAAIG